MANIIVVDDEVPRHERFDEIFLPLGHKVVHAYSYEEAKESMQSLYGKRQPFDLACLDHDLGQYRDGRDVARWMAGMTKAGPISGWRCPAKSILIHSQNIIAATEMQSIFLDMAPGLAPQIVRLLPFKSKP